LSFAPGQESSSSGFAMWPDTAEETLAGPAW
jgi:hypothetical protein